MRAYSTGARAALAFPKRRGYSRRNSKLAAFRLIQEAAAMALRVMSADSHMDLVYLPPDTFTSRMDPKWGDAAPHVVERDGRKWWVSRDAVLGPYGVYGPGVTGGKRGRILAEAGFATGKQTRPSHPIERREDQARDGVEAEVIYGIIGISRGLFTHQGISDHEMLTAVYHAYNRYIAEFNQTQPGRYYGLGWRPYIRSRLDDTYEERLADDLKLPLPPSAYFKRQMYATFQKDFHGVRAMAEIAPDNVMWGSDCPHRDGTWPFSQKAIEEQFRGIDPKIQRKMLWENVRRVYRIDE